MEGNPSKLAKQRRDVTFPDGEMVFKDETMQGLQFTLAGSDLLKGQIVNFKGQGDIVKTCSMKMLYTRPSWSFVGLSDFMAPVAKFQLAGDKIFIVIPFQSLSASFAATASGAPSLTALSHHMMSLSLQELVGAGGTCVLMRAGHFVWIPDSCFIGEFNLGVPSDTKILTSLSWVAMTKYHCGEDSVAQVLQTVQLVLGKLCQPSEKPLEAQLQVAQTTYQKMLELLKVPSVKVKPELQDDQEALTDESQALALAAPVEPASTVAQTAAELPTAPSQPDHADADADVEAQPLPAPASADTPACADPLPLPPHGSTSAEEAADASGSTQGITDTTVTEVPAATVETHAATHEPGTSPVAGDNALCHDALPAAAASKEADLATTEQTVQPPEQQGETTAIKMESLEGLPADMHSHAAEVIDSSQEQETMPASMPQTAGQPAPVEPTEPGGTGTCCDVSSDEDLPLTSIAAFTAPKAEAGTILHNDGNNEKDGEACISSTGSSSTASIATTTTTTTTTSSVTSTEAPEGSGAGSDLGEVEKQAAAESHKNDEHGNGKTSNTPASPAAPSCKAKASAKKPPAPTPKRTAAKAKVTAKAKCKSSPKAKAKTGKLAAEETHCRRDGGRPVC